MHVSRQPNTERWVQSNSPLSLVFERPRRLKACCGLIKASCGLIKPFGEGEVKLWRLRVRLTERNGGEMEKQVSDLDQCVKVRRWVRLTERNGGERVRLLCVRETVKVSESGEWFYEVLFFKILYLKSSIRASISLPSMWKIKDHSRNRVSETRFHF